MSMQYVFVRDRFAPVNEPHISVEERGFRFGDGVFETIAIHAGVLYQWDFHLHRLQQGLELLRIPFDLSGIFIHCKEILLLNQTMEGFLRISISRGVGSRGYLPVGDLSPCLVLETIPPPEPVATPISLFASNYEKISARALPVQAKLMGAGLNSTLARMEAADNGCFDALQCNHLGEICETSSANIFWLKGQVLQTPALSCSVLEGSTRAAILRLSPWPVEEGHYPLKVLRGAKSVCIANVSWKALPVGSLHPLGWEWDSDAFATELNRLLQEDVTGYNDRARIANI